MILNEKKLRFQWIAHVPFCLRLMSIGDYQGNFDFLIDILNFVSPMADLAN